MFTTHVSENLVIHTGQASISLEEILDTMRAWYANPEFDPDKPILWDLRDASIDAAGDEVAEWAEAMRQLISQHRAGRKTAWVLPSSEVAETAVDLLSSVNPENKVRIYHNDIEAAQSWLTTTIR